LNPDYTWTTGTGGFLYNSTVVEIINPCLQVAAPGLGNLLCLNYTAAAAGWNVNADHWLQNQ
jgi:hypothetical protein